MEVYYSEEECNDRVGKLLSGNNIDPRLSEAVAWALTTDLQVESTEDTDDSFEIKVGSWVIRDEDLDLFSILKDSALLYISTQLAGPVAPSVVAFAVTLARLLWNL